MVHSFRFGFRAKPPTTQIDKYTPALSLNAGSDLIADTQGQPTLAMESEAHTGLLMQPQERNDLHRSNNAEATTGQALTETRHAVHSSYNLDAHGQALSQFDDHSFYAGSRPLTVRDESDVVRSRVDSIDFWGDDVEAIKDPEQRRGARIEHRSIETPEAPEDAILVYDSDLITDWLSATESEYVTYGEPGRVPNSAILVFVEQWLAADANSYVAHSSVIDRVVALRDKVKQITADTVLEPMDSQLILVDATRADITITLPNGPGDVTIKRVDASHNQLVVIADPQRFTVSDLARFVSPGTEWFLL